MQPDGTAEIGRDLNAGWVRVSSLLDAVALHLFAVDRDLRLIHADGPLDPFTGVDSGRSTPHRPLGERLTDLLPEHERARWERLAHRAMEDSRQEAVGLVVTRKIEASDLARSRLAQVLARGFTGPGGVDGAVFVVREIPEWLARADNDGPSQETGRLDLARQFAATLNHTINNPLFVVSATLEDLLADEHDPAARKRLRNALDSVWKVAEAVKQFQELKRIVSVSYIPGYTMIDLDASSEG